jgi:methionyl-tRNA formyltransferase
MRLIFMGTPDFSVPVLQALVDAGHEIVAVYCQPPRPAGRGKKDRPAPVQLRAEELGLQAVILYRSGLPRRRRNLQHLTRISPLSWPMG